MNEHVDYILALEEIEEEKRGKKNTYQILKLSKRNISKE